MIRLGNNLSEKQEIIKAYIQENTIEQVFVFYPDIFPLTIEQNGVPIETIVYKNIIMYKFFYRLLEVINDKTLLVFNECMRTQNRSDLTYNCAHHYCNQTSHIIIFEQLPFIEQNNDFMILLDLLNKGKYKGKSFDYNMLQNEDIKTKQIDFEFKSIDIKTTEAIQKKYENKKESLFDNLGNADPDTIPRQLHIYVGNFKKSEITDKNLYVARNKRFKKENIETYRDIIKAKQQEEYIIIDFPHRRIDFNDFLKTTRIKKLQFLNSGLKVDKYYMNELLSWIKRLEEFYAEANICR